MDLIKEVIIFSLDKCEQCISWIIFKCALLFPNQIKNIVTNSMETDDLILNGPEPWHIQIHNDRFYPRVFAYGSVGWGESYLDGWWDCEQLDLTTSKSVRARLPLNLNWHYSTLFMNFKFKWLNMQSKHKAKEVIDLHYNLGTDLFEAMLGSYMNYSCAYWKNSTTDLDKAQIDKMELIAKKLMLKPGMKVLDIGIGYGLMDKYLCENYEVSIVGYTLSKEMAMEATKRCQSVDVQVICADYRDVTGKFDRIFSVEMLEHVGPSNYKTYFEIANRCLVDDGLFLLQSSMVNGSDDMPSTIPVVHKLIFPNVYVPRLEQIVEATKGLFIIEDLHNFSYDQYLTMRAFDENFVKNWHSISEKYGDGFYRYWRFYLGSGAGGFHARYLQYHQIVFSKIGLEGGYISVR